jgi:hypothetical protein
MAEPPKQAFSVIDVVLSILRCPNGALGGLCALFNHQPIAAGDCARFPLGSDVRR